MIVNGSGPVLPAQPQGDGDPSVKRLHYACIGPQITRGVFPLISADMTNGDCSTHSGDGQKYQKALESQLP